MNKVVDLCYRLLHFSENLTKSAFVQEDVDMYRSSPPLPGIFHPFYLLPGAHASPQPNPKESLSMESYIDSSNSEFGHAEAGEAADGDESGGHSSSLSEDTRVDHPKGTWSTARKHRGASQPGVDG